MTEFYVRALPVPQGSLTGGKHLHYTAKGLGAWRELVAHEAQRTVGEILNGPVSVSLLFTLKRPKRPKDDLPIVKPDLDKLVRAVLDALSGVVYRDDAQVCRLFATKNYGTPGVFVSVRSLRPRTGRT